MELPEFIEHIIEDDKKPFNYEIIFLCARARRIPAPIAKQIIFAQLSPVYVFEYCKYNCHDYLVHLWRQLFTVLPYHKHFIYLLDMSINLGHIEITKLIGTRLKLIDEEIDVYADYCISIRDADMLGFWLRRRSHIPHSYYERVSNFPAGVDVLANLGVYPNEKSTYCFIKKRRYAMAQVFYDIKRRRV